MTIGTSTSFSRRFSRFLLIACLLAVAVPASIAVSTDFAQAASAGGGGGGGRGGGGGGAGHGDAGGGGGDDTRECASGTCMVLVDCAEGQCGPIPPCTGASCGKIPDRISYAQTPSGCQVKTCEVRGDKMLCSTEKAKDAKLCLKKS
jgi:hypothetical protein